MRPDRRRVTQVGGSAHLATEQVPRETGMMICVQGTCGDVLWRRRPVRAGRRLPWGQTAARESSSWALGAWLHRPSQAWSRKWSALLEVEA